MYETKDPIGQLVHLWVDGGFSRRELIKRVAQRTGSVAAAVTALAGYEELRAEEIPESVRAQARVAADDIEIDAGDIEFSGPQGRLLAYLAQPKGDGPFPGVVMLHENRGLVEHHRDVTRRLAKSGFVGLGIDLLSRQGGTALFPEAAQQTAAYGRTAVTERREDIFQAVRYLKSLGNVVNDRIGIVGFCAGGGNIWDFVINHPDELAAAVPFYGAPSTVEDVEKVKTPMLAIYAERDRALTLRLFPIATAMVTQQKVFGMFVYEGVAHAFHNDTGAAYNGPAAADAWMRAMFFFDKFLRAPRA
jgi:carboxymethylenebutenolidase